MNSFEALEIIIAGMALIGAGLVTAKKSKLQVVGLHMWLIGAVIGIVFFAMIHLYVMAFMCTCCLIVCIHGINTRLTPKKVKVDYE